MKPSNILLSLLEDEIPCPTAAISLLLSLPLADRKGGVRRFRARLACLASDTGDNPMTLTVTLHFASINQMLGGDLTSDDREALAYTQAWLRDPKEGLPWENSQDHSSIFILKSMYGKGIRESAKSLGKMLLAVGK